MLEIIVKHVIKHSKLCANCWKLWIKNSLINLETVAGEATLRLSTSNIIVIVGRIFIISPDVRQSFLLSSNTVFMFSIHTASTGPSKMYQRLFKSAAAIPALSNVEKIPSVLKKEEILYVILYNFLFFFFYTFIFLARGKEFCTVKKFTKCKSLP